MDAKYLWLKSFGPSSDVCRTTYAVDYHCMCVLPESNIRLHSGWVITASKKMSCGAPTQGCLDMFRAMALMLLWFPVSHSHQLENRTSWPNGLKSFGAELRSHGMKLGTLTLYCIRLIACSDYCFVLLVIERSHAEDAHCLKRHFAFDSHCTTSLLNNSPPSMYFAARYLHLHRSENLWGVRRFGRTWGARYEHIHRLGSRVREDRFMLS